MFPLVFRLLLSLLAALPIAAHAGQTVLRLQGSNTIGSVLAPALVRGMLQTQAVQDIQILPGTVANEVQVQGHTAQGELIQVNIAAHGSSTGFTALKNGDADLAAASRPIKDSELVDLEALGDLKSADAEQVIALDGMAVIVHPDNPLPQLTTEQLAKIFAGRITTWDALGLGSGPIRLYARDDRSGTFETFKSLVLDPHDLTLATSTTRFESGEQLAADSMSFFTRASSNSVMSVFCLEIKSCSSLIRFMASSRWWLSTSDCSFCSLSLRISSAMAS